jgi:hypothetical protein
LNLFAGQLKTSRNYIVKMQTFISSSHALPIIEEGVPWILAPCTPASPFPQLRQTKKKTGLSDEEKQFVGDKAGLEQHASSCLRSTPSLLFMPPPLYAPLFSLLPSHALSLPRLHISHYP